MRWLLAAAGLLPDVRVGPQGETRSSACHASVQEAEAARSEASSKERLLLPDGRNKGMIKPS